MLWTITFVLLGLWAYGLATSVAMGGYIHVLLLGAVVVMLFRVFQGPRTG
jgi:hypothetical protein